ncbi:MAG: D-alanine--D-alanine ligase [Lachnospiraceae bacterium]|jgi:D-alanine-D-alanine ligase|nr:D-alanine--D-alanine ligase [Lachnospiraceae bacterium]
MSTKVAIIFGGQSSEHEVSCISAATIIKNMDTSKYDQVLIGITKEGKWLFVENVGRIEDGSWVDGHRTAVFSPDATKKEILVLHRDGTYESIGIDVVFPVLHGLYGEDGTIQGLFEMAGLPYVGCGVLASAVSMDKLFTKIIVEHLGVAQAKFEEVRAYQLREDLEGTLDRIEAALPYPVFVKPSQAGSSKGVSKAANRQELIDALNVAREHDSKILVEETINGREIECGVLGTTNHAEASCVGEILAASNAAFYDYDAKYNNADSKTVVNPELPDGKADEIRDYASKIFSAVDGFGLARVDFFLERETNRVVFNEINTLPGFTSISMYPMLWNEMGKEIKVLIDELIELALKREPK